MKRLSAIFLDFLEANIRKFFWGTLVLLVCLAFYLLGEVKLTVGGLSALMGFAMSQLKVNIPSNGKTGPTNAHSNPN